MKIATSPVSVVAPEEVVKHDLSIATENVGTIIKALISGIYTNPLRTILIEYIQNALDSHRAVRQRKNISVTLPTFRKPVYVVEDYGLGMSEDDVRRLLASVCASGKKSDKFVGGFGIGFYAASAYCDSFTFRIRKDGTESEWAAAFGEGSGTLLRLSKKKTSQPNGVRVEIPIRETDIMKFNKFVSDGLFAWTKGIGFTTGDGESVAANPFTKYGRLHLDTTGQSRVHITVGGIPVETIPVSSVLQTVSQMPEALRGLLVNNKLLTCFKHEWHRMGFAFHYDIPVKEAKLSTNREKIFLTDAQYADILTYVYNTLDSEEARIYREVQSLNGLESVVDYYQTKLPQEWRYNLHYWDTVKHILKTVYKVDTSYFDLPRDETNRISIVWQGTAYPIPYTCKELVICRRQSKYDPSIIVYPEQNRVEVAITRYKPELAEQLRIFYSLCGANIVEQYIPRGGQKRKIRCLCFNKTGDKIPFSYLPKGSDATVAEFIIPQEQELSHKWGYEYIAPFIKMGLPCSYVLSAKHTAKGCNVLDGNKLQETYAKLTSNTELMRAISQYGGFFRIHTGNANLDEDYIDFEKLNSSVFTPGDMANLLDCFPKGFSEKFMPPQKAFAVMKGAYRYIRENMPFATEIMNGLLKKAGSVSYYSARGELHRLLRSLIAQRDPILLKKVLTYLKSKKNFNEE